MINADNLTEEEVKKSGWQDELPESDEMESERNAAESCIALDCAHDSLAYIFRFQDRDDAGLHAGKHSCIDVIWGDGCDVYVALHLLEFDTHRV